MGRGKCSRATCSESPPANLAEVAEAPGMRLSQMRSFGCRALWRKSGIRILLFVPEAGWLEELRSGQPPKPKEFHQ